MKYSVKNTVKDKATKGQTALLFDSCTGTLYEINLTAYEIFKILKAEPKTAEAVCDELRRKYSAEKAEIENDVKESIEYMLTVKVLEPVNE